MQKLGAAGGVTPLLEVFFEQRDRLIRVATRITGCRSQAEDIVHDAYIKLDGPGAPAEDIRSQGVLPGPRGA